MADDDLSRLRLSPEQRQVARPRRRWPALVLALAAGAGAVLVFFVWDRSQSRDVQAAPAQAAEADAPAPGVATRSGAVVAGGFVEARRSAVIYPGRDGVVAAVHVEPGQLLQKGDVLLELIADTAAAEVAAAAAELARSRARHRLVVAGSRTEEVARAEAEAEAAEAEWQQADDDLGRTRNLAADGVVPAAEQRRAEMREEAARARLEAARAAAQLLRAGSREEEIALAAAEVEQAAATLERSRAQLDLSRLKAPFDCAVVRIDLEPGEVVSMLSTQGGQPGIEIADVSELWVRVDVPETRIADVALGAPARVVVDALGSAELAAEVVEIAAVADRQSNTISVAARIHDPPPLLRPNMSARVTIEPRAKPIEPRAEPIEPRAEQEGEARP